MNLNQFTEEDVVKKAKEIFLNFYTVELWTGNHLDKEVAKECALIMVKEIITITSSAFWYRVEKEIKEM